MRFLSLGFEDTHWEASPFCVCACVPLSPLHLAARSGLKQAVQELLSRGASVQMLDENGRCAPPSLPHRARLAACRQPPCLPARASVSDGTA